MTVERNAFEVVDNRSEKKIFEGVEVVVKLWGRENMRNQGRR